MLMAAAMLLLDTPLRRAGRCRHWRGLMILPRTEHVSTCVTGELAMPLRFTLFDAITLRRTARPAPFVYTCFSRVRPPALNSHAAPIRYAITPLLCHADIIVMLQLRYCHAAMLCCLLLLLFTCRCLRHALAAAAAMPIFRQR